jgi:ketosteroid isomerase-like protein
VRPCPGGGALRSARGEAVMHRLGDTGRAMSQENVELVRRYYEAYVFAQDGFDRWMEYWSDEIDHRPATAGIDDPGPIHGKNAMRQHIRDWIDTFDDFWFEAVELIDAGQDTVVAVERFGGRAKLSGVETDQTSGVVLTIREGRSPVAASTRPAPTPSKPWGCRSRRSPAGGPASAPQTREGETRAHTPGTPEMRIPAFLEVPGRANRMPLKAGPPRHPIPNRAAG